MEVRQAAKVRRMFDGIAGRYDLLNHLLSVNLDRRWRRAASAALAPETGERILDLCCGTGDLSIALARSAPPGTFIVGCDFSEAMLEQASRKFRRRRLSECRALRSDALALPFPDAMFDGLSVAFGVRNLESIELGFREMLRVLRPGGRMVVLEFSQPGGRLLAGTYRFYRDRVLPRLGQRISGRSGPYAYLARTIAEFDEPSTLAGRIREAGFAGCGWSSLSGGIVAIHTAHKAQTRNN